MQVEIINKDQVFELFRQWGMFASVCYDTKTNKPEKIAMNCLESGHTSGSRSQYINFKISGVPRSTVDQMVRHEVGVCKNVQSFRYVNKENLHLAIPIEIEDNAELLKEYFEYEDKVGNFYQKIYDYVKKKTGNTSRATEQARHVLPISTETSFCIGFTLEAFIHLCHTRLCSRAEDEIRNLVKAMRNELLTILPQMTDYLVPQCEYLMWCPEANGCGRYPSRDVVKAVMRKRTS